MKQDIAEIAGRAVSAAFFMGVAFVLIAASLDWMGWLGAVLIAAAYAGECYLVKRAHLLAHSHPEKQA